MPAARHFSSSPFMACAVSATIGIVRCALLLAADLARGLVAIELRHLAVHQDEVEAAASSTR